MLLDDLLSRRLVILTGKGGVGKSVVGAALAVAARDRGKRVLLVEVAAAVEASRLLGGPPSQGRETEALPGLFTLNLDPATVMDEYVVAFGSNLSRAALPLTLCTLLVLLARGKGAVLPVEASDDELSEGRAARA